MMMVDKNDGIDFYGNTFWYFYIYVRKVKTNRVFEECHHRLKATDKQLE